MKVLCGWQKAEVRLADDGGQGAGVVEMRLGGEWGAVCDSRFDDFDAQVRLLPSLCAHCSIPI